MIPFGYTLKSAREAKGYTIGQIAEMTHMMSSMVQDLENENFSRLAAPIYGRGFVKLYCEAVGLDPKPLVAEFMDLYNGNHDPVIRERPVSAPPPEPKPAPQPEEVAASEPPTPAETSVLADETPEELLSERPAEPETDASPICEAPRAALRDEPPAPVAPEPPSYGIRQPGLFDAPAAEPLPPAEPVPEACPPPQADYAPATAAEAVPPAPETPPAKHTFARYASPLDDHCREPHGSFATTFSLWRWCTLALAGLLVLWGVVAGLKALYRATTGAPAATTEPAPEPPAKPADDVKPAETKPADKAQPTTAAKPAVTKKSADKASNRTPQTIPPLYVD